jgi:hypothetical protein
MYAIKIINGEHTYLYLAEEISYSFKICNGVEEFYSNVENGDNVFVVGEVAGGEFEYLIMFLYDRHTDREISKMFYIMPNSWIYIMQEGKTIEAINIHEIKQGVKV